MPFEKGNQAAAGRAPDRPWRDMLMLALKERAGKGKTDPQRLRKVADAVVEAAMNGDMTAAREIGDRLDGKATQVVAGNNDGEPVKHTIEVVYVKPHD
jgi:hypothetical protein